MAIPALELRPRGALHLVDAALRACATSAGPWIITLPAGAAVLAALFNLAEAIARKTSVGAGAALLTVAWALRAVAQGAASDYLEHQLLAHDPASVRRSWLRAFGRAPSLIVTACWQAAIDALLFFGTLGIGFFFVGSHTVGLAATMRGQGHPLAIVATCARLLGPTRQVTTRVRLSLAAVQLVLAVNLHLAAQAAAAWGGLFGLNLAFAARFASPDNIQWLAALAGLTFALCEPLRAAAASLLLLDGQVRQGGLDLLAAVEQLPRRAQALPTAPLAIGLLLLAAPSLAEPPAETRPGGLATHGAQLQRIDQLALECDFSEEVRTGAFDSIGSLPAPEGAALGRLVTRLERLAYDDENCEVAESGLNSWLHHLNAPRAVSASEAASVRQRAVDILARREFQEPGEEAEQASSEEEEKTTSWIGRLLERFFDWLTKHSSRQDKNSGDPGALAPGPGVRVLLFVLIAAALATLAVLVLRSVAQRAGHRQGAPPSAEPTESALDHDSANALSRPPETWAGLADDLANRGQFREAIRHLYLALLSRLHAAGSIDYNPARSNWEYWRDFRGSGDLKGRFRDLTGRFDLAWYGNLDATLAAWSAFRRVAEPMVTPPTAGATHG